MGEVQQIMNSGKLHKVGEVTNRDPKYHHYLQLMEKYNSLGYTEEGEAEKKKVLKEVFAEVGENAYVQAPYYGMWGGIMCI